MSFFDRMGLTIGGMFGSEPPKRKPDGAWDGQAGSEYQFQGQMATDRVYQDPRFVNVKKTLNVFKNMEPEHDKECVCKGCMAKKDAKKY